MFEIQSVLSTAAAPNHFFVHLGHTCIGWWYAFWRSITVKSIAEASADSEWVHHTHTKRDLLICLPRWRWGRWRWAKRLDIPQIKHGHFMFEIQSVLSTAAAPNHFFVHLGHTCIGWWYAFWRSITVKSIAEASADSEWVHHTHTQSEICWYVFPPLPTLPHCRISTIS